MPLPPYPVMPAPRTWSRGDKILTPLLRNDLRNAALLLENRPLLVAAQTTTGQSVVGTSTWVPLQLDTEYVDNWARHQIPSAQYPVPLGGWYLLEGDVSMGVAVGNTVACGFNLTQAGVVGNYQCGMNFANGINAVQATGALLAQLDPNTSDSAAIAIWQNSTVTNSLASAKFKAEWVAQPTSLGYGTGTVVASPQPAAMWAPGGGTTLIQNINPGAIAMRVASTTGIVVGGYLGLDYYLGQPVLPTAEVVQVQSISGGNVFISAPAYPHAANGLVAVPVSAAFMNQQARDLINFLAYPPIAFLYGGTPTSLVAQTWPAATVFTWGSLVVDNFSGWNPSNRSQYVFPVSGVYEVYGQVSLQSGGPPTLSAGLSISGQQIMWGVTLQSPAGAARPACATVRRLVRVTAGQAVQLYGSTSATTATYTTVASGSRLIVVFRGF